MDRKWIARQMVSGAWDIADDDTSETVARTTTAERAHLIAAGPEMRTTLEAVIANMAPLVQAGDPLGLDTDRIARAALQIAAAR